MNGWTSSSTPRVPWHHAIVLVTWVTVLVPGLLRAGVDTVRMLGCGAPSTGSIVGSSFDGSTEGRAWSPFEELDESFGASSAPAESSEGGWWSKANQSRLLALRESLEGSGADPLFLALLNDLQFAPGAFEGSREAAIFFEAVDEFLGARRSARRAEASEGPDQQILVAVETYRSVLALTAMTQTMQKWFDEEKPWVEGLATHEQDTSGKFHLRRDAVTELAHQSVLSFAIAQARPIIADYDRRARSLCRSLRGDPGSPGTIRAAMIERRRRALSTYFCASETLSKHGGKGDRSLACMDDAKDAASDSATGDVVGEGRNACALLRKLVSCLHDLDQAETSPYPKFI